MTRRRLILAACVAVIVLGAAWWLFGNWLTAEERKLVGTWHGELDRGFGPDRVQYAADHLFLTISPPTPDHAPPYRWYVRSGSLVIDCEPSLIRRLLRPLAPSLGMTVRQVVAYPLEVDEGRMIVFDPGGGSSVWIRDSGD
jgi:hypothetical protein